MRYVSRGADARGQTGVAARARARLARARSMLRRGPLARAPPGRSTSRPDEAGDDPIANRGDRYVPEPPGTVKKMRFWYGPYVMPAGWDANRVDVDIPVHNGMILQVEPELRINPDWTGAEPPGRAHPPRPLVRARPGQRGGQLHRRQHRVDLRQRRRGDARRLHAALERAAEGPLLRRVHRPRRAAGDDLHAPQQDRGDDGRLRRAQRHVQVRHARAAERHAVASTATCRACSSAAPSTCRGSARATATRRRGTRPTTCSPRTASRGRSSGRRRSTAR